MRVELAGRVPLATSLLRFQSALAGPECDREAMANGAWGLTGGRRSFRPQGVPVDSGNGPGHGSHRLDKLAEIEREKIEKELGVWYSV